MIPSSGDIPYCKRCQAEIEPAIVACPECNFEPKQRGLRLAGFSLLLTVGAIMGAQLSMVVWPSVGPWLLGVTAVGFISALVLFFAAMIATPYRLGGLFNRV